MWFYGKIFYKTGKDKMDRNNEFKKYVENLEEYAKTHPEKAKIEAEEALIETGVLNKDGSTKKEIITESVEPLIGLLHIK